MTKRSNTDNEAASARAHRGFNRVAGLVRASADIARATDRLARIARQQIPIVVSDLVPRTVLRSEMKRSAEDDIGSRSAPEGNRQVAGGSAIHGIHGFAMKMKAFDAMTRVGESVLGGKATDRVGLASRSKTSIPSRGTFDRESRWPQDAADSSRSRLVRMIQQSSSGVEALARIRDSERRFGVGGDSVFGKARVESGAARFERGTGVPLGGLAGRAKRMLDDVGDFSIGSAGSERSLGKYIAASRAPGSGGSRSSMVAPAVPSRPEFAEPMRGVYGQESRSAPGSITINSTPTVVINASEASTDVERQVIRALRAHRDELFDQLKRESVRRERAEF